MNALFIFAGGLDLQSNHAKLREFWRLDNEIEEWQNKYTSKELFHSLAYAVMVARAKSIVQSLN